MINAKPPFKADVVGSLLRPQPIHDARARHEKKEISAEALWENETKAVEEAVAMQKEVGLRVCTDGEFHRRHWFLDFLEKIDGVEVHGGLPVKFHNEQGE
ncbi:MAG: 5-methyltetrahydropteroyltriglutamate--homocysteine S-methyltransferase, partial [Xanthobacteraceae bacterium]